MGLGVSLSEFVFDFKVHGLQRWPSGQVKRNLQDITVFASRIMTWAGFSKRRFSWKVPKLVGVLIVLFPRRATVLTSHKKS